MACVGRRHLILIGVMIAAGLLGAPAGPVLDRIPELLIPVFLAYGMVFLVAFRLTTGRSLAAEALAAAGVRSLGRTRPTRRGAGHVAGRVLLALSILLAATAAALWARSLRGAERLEWASWDVLGVTPSRWVRRFHDGMVISLQNGGIGVERQRSITLDPQYVLNKNLQVLPKSLHKLAWLDGPGGARLYAGLRTRPNVLTRFGIEYAYLPMGQRLPGDPRESHVWLFVPLRLVVAAAAVVPLCAGALALLRLRPSKPGHCVNCGYDLRATPGRCPECGEVAPDAERLPHVETENSHAA
jgi:hypothetical protein